MRGYHDFGVALQDTRVTRVQKISFTGGEAIFESGRAVVAIPRPWPADFAYGATGGGLGGWPTGTTGRPVGDSKVAVWRKLPSREGGERSDRRNASVNRAAAN